MDLADYRKLLKKVDDKFTEIHSRNQQHMQCGKGCHSCCQPGLSVFEVEKEALRTHILATPGLQEELEQLEQEDPHQGSRCKFLSAAGACSVYEARPVICRSHGTPIWIKHDGHLSKDVCPKNFSGLDLDAVATEDFINIELLNMLLTVINQRFLGAAGASLKRVPLAIKSVMASPTHNP
jgi:Fe-S-cluster containining protein